MTQLDKAALEQDLEAVLVSRQQYVLALHQAQEGIARADGAEFILRALLQRLEAPGAQEAEGGGFGAQDSREAPKAAPDPDLGLSRAAEGQPQAPHRAEPPIKLVPRAVAEKLVAESK